MGFLSVLSFAQSLVKERARPGDTLIDATVGTGVDTLFLARVAGQTSRVYGFDVQEEALQQAARRLQADGICVEIGVSVLGAGTRSGGDDAGAYARRSFNRSAAAARVKLLHRSHADMAAALPAAVHGKVAAVMFNLGYLPGGDPAVITLPSSTLPALDAALRLLRPGGIVTAVLYTGHAGGAAEADAVCRWAESLPRGEAHVICYRPLNLHVHAPYLIAAEKR